MIGESQNQQTFKKVRLSDGRIVQFPGSMTDEEMGAAIKKNFPELQPESLGKQLTRGPRNLGAAMEKLMHKAYNIPSSLAEMGGHPDVAEMLHVGGTPEYYQKKWGLPAKQEWH